MEYVDVLKYSSKFDRIVLMNITIRFADQSDFSLVRTFDPHSQYIDPEKIKSKLRDNEIIFAFDSEKPIGIIKFSYFWATRPYMDLIWVDESHRGKGVGSQLLIFLEKYLVEQGYTYLYTSSEENETAPQAWYKGHGFVQCGTLSAINLPHDENGEVFFYKHIATTDPTKEELRTYNLLTK